MTAAHFLFALAMTVYILIAIRFEERDLVSLHDGYAEYRRQVPMLVPRLIPLADRPDMVRETLPAKAGRAGELAGSMSGN
jgi:hypothetical protein